MRTVVFLGSLLVPTAAAWAQSEQPAFGHWKTTLSLPTGELALELDLGKGADGAVVGTMSQPAQQIKGLPLSKVVVNGKTVSFDVPGGGDASFSGSVSDDGKSLAGNLSNLQGTLPVTFERTGDAVIAPPPVSAPITKQLEGTWSGTLEALGQQFRLVMTLTNHPDKTSTGTIVNVDQGGLAVPVTIEQHDADITIVAPATGATYKATLDAAGTALTGTFSQAGLSLPLVFRRDAPK
jgi:hypothetical protein